MYMIDLDSVVGFEWDDADRDKSYVKHGITPNEAEEIFFDEKLETYNDIEHSQKEVRYIAIGKTKSETILYTIFTIRSSRIRIISARIANRKERNIYEKHKT
jgi:uncharacterized DUF497 family protein